MPYTLYLIVCKNETRKKQTKDGSFIFTAPDVFPYFLLLLRLRARMGRVLYH